MKQKTKPILCSEIVYFIAQSIKDKRYPIVF